MLRRLPLWLGATIVSIGLVGWRELAPTGTRAPATAPGSYGSAGVRQQRQSTPSQRLAVPRLDLDAVHISIKTSTAKDDYIQRRGRLAGIVSTWFPAVAEQAWFVSDINNSRFWALSGGHLVPTPCPASHARSDLCCKLEHEFGWFHRRRQRDRRLKWFCHVDDDMYLLPGNLVKLLGQYDPAERWFVGPTNLWPDDTQHFTPTATGKDTGLHHPMNGVYCLSAPTIEAVYPNHMAGGNFARSCGRSPDDVTITDLISTVAGINMTVSNAFHHQHSRSYKLPFYAPSVLRDHAVTLYGYENLPALHALLYPRVAPSGPGGRPVDWWKTIAENFTTIPNRGSRVTLGFNYCRLVSPPHGGDGDGGAAVNKSGAPTPTWCGPPVTRLRELEPLCESRATYKVMHPTHNHGEPTQEQCPWTDTSMPQAYGTAIGDGAAPDVLRQFLGGKRKGDVGYQFSKGSSARVWSKLAGALANAGTPGTCCVPNPSIPAAEGGQCYWTAKDQSQCIR